jgi:hypothetical protein
MRAANDIFSDTPNHNLPQTRISAGGHDDKVDVVIAADFGYGPVVQHLPNEKSRHAAKLQLKRLAEKTMGSHLPWEIVVLDGPAHKIIIEAANLLRIALIVLPTHNTSMQEEIGRKTIINHTISHVTRPIFIV